MDVKGTRRGRRDTENSPTRCVGRHQLTKPRDSGGILLRSWELSDRAPLLEEAWWLLTMSPTKTPELFSYFSLHGGHWSIGLPSFLLPLVYMWLFHWASCTGQRLSYMILIVRLCCAFPVSSSFCLSSFCSNVSYLLLFSDKTEKYFYQVFLFSSQRSY